MDAVDASSKSTSDNPTRIRYGRDYIFSLKERVLSSDTDIFDHIDLNTIAQRAGRGKSSKQTSFGKGQADRNRESKGIVLGPQKRTWNTGCHVSQTESADNSGRAGKNGSEYRTGERYSKPDHRRDYRNGFRDRGCHRRIDNSFSGSHLEHKERKPRHVEEEPEWFSGGPTTVSETIELGGILDTEGECSRNSKVHDSSAGTLENSTDSASPNRSKQDITTQQPENSSKMGESHIHCENQGSRFKHLFGSADTSVAPKKESINEQLNRLFKGTVDSDTNPDRNNVLQIENKLRSLLLGRRASSGNDESNQNITETKVDKTKVLTVEEIESQLSLPSSASHSSVETVNGEQKFNSPTATSLSDSTNASNPQYSQSNLASILQSLAFKQQQTACSRQNTGALNSLGILSNPAVRLPSSTNAMSASARINQLHQTEPINPQASNDSQGVLGRILENGPTIPGFPAPQHPSSIPQAQPRPIGLNIELNSKYGGMGLPTQISTVTGVPGTRRPIVKSQIGIPSMSIDGSNYDVQSQKYVSGLQDIDRRLLNMVAGQQSRASGDKVSYNHVFSGAFNGTRVHNAQLIETSSVPVGSTNNNHNTYSQQVPPSYCRSTESDNAFGFLSHLVEMDRSSYGPRNHETLPVSVKPKTLEEIERQEVFNTNLFF